MNPPLRISFRNMNRSAAVEARIEQKLARLQHHFPQISACHAALERQHRHQHQGRLYHVVLVLTVPGSEVVVSHVSHDERAHEDVYLAIRDAFDAAERQLEAHSGRRRARPARDDLLQADAAAG